MFRSIRFVVLALMMIGLTLLSASIRAEEDPCGKTGIYISNQTLLDLWYTRNGGPCAFFNRRHIVTVDPKDTFILYRDMTCKTVYCPGNPTYDTFKSLDADHNCRVRILPECALSDM